MGVRARTSSLTAREVQSLRGRLLTEKSSSLIQGSGGAVTRHACPLPFTKTVRWQLKLPVRSPFSPQEVHCRRAAHAVKPALVLLCTCPVACADLCRPRFPARAMSSKPASKKQGWGGGKGQRFDGERVRCLTRIDVGFAIIAVPRGTNRKERVRVGGNPR